MKYDNNIYFLKKAQCEADGMGRLFLKNKYYCHILMVRGLILVLS